MTTDHIQRRIDQLLGEIQAASQAGDWRTAQIRSEDVLRLNPFNEAAQASYRLAKHGGAIPEPPPPPIVESPTQVPASAHIGAAELSASAAEPPPNFKRTGKLTIAAAIAIVLFSLSHVLAGFADVGFHGYVVDYEEGRADYFETAQKIDDADLSPLVVFFGFIAVVLFLVWIYRIVKNVVAVGVKPVLPPWGSVALSLIPVFGAYFVMRDAMAKTRAGGKPLLEVFMAGWVVIALLGIVFSLAGSNDPETVSEWKRFLLYSAWGHFLYGIAGFCMTAAVLMTSSAVNKAAESTSAVLAPISPAR